MSHAIRGILSGKDGTLFDFDAIWLPPVDRVLPPSPADARGRSG